jgi:hypothetical protein
VTISYWILILLGTAVVVFFVLLAFLMLLDWLGAFGRGKWE